MSKKNYNYSMLYVFHWYNQKLLLNNNHSRPRTFLSTWYSPVYNYFIFVCYRLIPTYNDGDGDDGSALFWILDFIEYSMYFTTIYLVKRVITLLDLFWQCNKRITINDYTHQHRALGKFCRARNCRT